MNMFEIMLIIIILSLLFIIYNYYSNYNLLLIKMNDIRIHFNKIKKKKNNILIKGEDKIKQKYDTYNQKKRLKTNLNNLKIAKNEDGQNIKHYDIDEDKWRYIN